MTSTPTARIVKREAETERRLFCVLAADSKAHGQTAEPLECVSLMIEGAARHPDI